ncbi:hypothetical protein GO986_14430 [Deinococcus sp. HMF7620]|uniref:Lipoprotein n=1 Tax=Deinococcus arboris TaxID=2682977 RepID=A0A7C9HSN2_9DEIO|nr:hypothetical protein [Deinococcus arboris]MVN87954.1 hypothetical protein [Deinococcus arboris]
MRRLPFLSLALTGLLAACTGTEETTPALRLIVLEGAATLRGITVTNATTSTSPAATPSSPVSVTGGVSVHPGADARRFVLVRTEAAETRTPELALESTFPAPGFTPVCYVRAAQNPGLSRLLVLSDCNGVQRLALYRDAALLWQVTLPTFLPPAPGSDTPPVRLAVQGEVGLVTRPRLGGGSEVLRVAIPVGGSAAQVSEPLPIPAVYDLAAYGTEVYAATDSGVQRLNGAGAPEATSTVAALGTGRYDRLWAGPLNQRLLAAWRSNVLSGQASTPLRVWNGSSTTAGSAATVTTFSDLRDLTFTPDGYLYTITGTALAQHDTQRGLQSGTWNSVTLPVALNDARSLTWTLAPEQVPTAP